MRSRLCLIFAALAFATGAFAQQDGGYQIGFAANLNIGDSVINLSNDGAIVGFVEGLPFCVNVYVFDPQEEEIACCGCAVTPDGLNSLSAKNDLISNTLTPVTPTSIVIKLISTFLNPSATAICNAAGPYGAGDVLPGMLAWGTTLEPGASPGTYGPVNVPFINGTLNTTPVTGELDGLTSVCSFIQSNGTGYGMCNNFCGLGALSGAKK
ncbi:MAG: hypothetical protein ABSB35_03790 [Bryobacteraceae bacterium]|jgi:hypothetical protein